MSPLDKIIAKATEPTNPWFHAVKAARDYITPEDVTAAMEAGGTVKQVIQPVLQAFELGAVEDSSCTAFVALRMFKGKQRAPSSSSPRARSATDPARRG